MKQQWVNFVIAVISITIPLVVVLLIYLKPPDLDWSLNPKLFPVFNASLNATTAVLLLTGYYFIRKKKQHHHVVCMVTALCLSVLFLISYVIYHALTEPTSFGGAAWLRPIYYFVLITHVVLAAVIVPLVLITVSRALQKRFDRHRIIARITLPLWLYVAVSGVAVFLFLRPYY